MYLKKSLAKQYATLFKNQLPKRDFRAAVVLAGCGVNDGSEITEAVSLLIALSKFGGEY